MASFFDKVRSKIALEKNTEKAKELLRLQAKVAAQTKKLAAEAISEQGVAILTSPSGEVAVVKKVAGDPGSPSVFKNGHVPKTTVIAVKSAVKKGAKPLIRMSQVKRNPGRRPRLRRIPLPAPLAAAAAAAPGTVPEIITKRGNKVKNILFPMLIKRLGGGKNAWIMEHIITVYVQGDLPAFERGLSQAGFDKPEIDEIEKNLGERVNNAAEAFDMPLPAGVVTVKQKIEKPGPVNHFLFGGERNFVEEARQKRRGSALKERQAIAAADPSRRPEPVSDVRDLLDDEGPMSIF